jgi:hypothetical protein
LPSGHGAATMGPEVKESPNVSTVEFRSRIEDGTIRVPKRYLRRLRGQTARGPVRVTLHLPEQSREPDLIDLLLAKPLSIPDFVPLRREQAHERG